MNGLRAQALSGFLLLIVTAGYPSSWALRPAAARNATANGVVFRLGRFNGSSGEFAQGTPAGTVRVAAACPGAAAHWYAFQAETAASAPGRQISFTQPGQPRKHYMLAVSLLIEHASVPALQVRVNGRPGTFYLEPRLDNTGEDGGAIFFPSYSRAHLTIAIPASMLHSGQNTIALSAVSSSPGPEVPDAGFNYDAIELTSGDHSASEEPAMRIDPTVFFRRHNGALEEALDVYVRPGGSVIRSADFTIGSRQFSVDIQRGADWGEQTRRVYVPVFASSAPVHTELQEETKTVRSTLTLQPAKQWTVYVVPHIHLDLGYTDYQAKVAAVQARVVDEALDLIALHPAFRFSLDGMWSLQQFLETRRPEDRARALAALKASQLFVPAQYANLLTGFASGETLIRSLYPSAEFDREHELPLNYANITDVPSYSWSYASILAAAGIPQLAAGSNNGRAPVLLHGHLNQTPFYWEGPDGGRVLMWYSHHYHQMWTTFGLPPLIHAGEQTLPLFLQQFENPKYKASATILYGSQAENTDLYPGQASLASDWNRQYAFPHLEYSGFHEALSAIAAGFHGDLPVVRGDGGPYWEDGIAADAYYAATERETEARAPSAEKLATLASLMNPRIAVDMPEFRSMWQNMVLMDEHTWTSFDVTSDPKSEEAAVQLSVKDAHAIRASELAGSLIRRSMAELADEINVPAGSLVVFNPLNWQRSGPVTVELRDGQQIVDAATGKPMAISTMRTGKSTANATFWAADVPAVGYKTYRLRSAAPLSRPPSAKPVQVLENEFYRVQLDPVTGSVRSIFDKQLHRELVDAKSPYRFGQYLYVTSRHIPGHADEFVVHRAKAGRLVSVEHTPLGLTAHLQSSDVNTPTIDATITLSSHRKAILFTEDVTKQETTADEGVYFAFPFAAAHPQFRYAIQNGVVDPAHDMYPGAGLDWFSVQHWAAVQGDGMAAAVLPLDASLLTIGDITRQRFPTQFGTRKPTLFSYVMNNYWHTNYRASQGGHFLFRYVVTSASSIDPVDLSHLGWDEATPLEATEVNATDKAVPLQRPLDGNAQSFLDLADPALVLEAWKPAEDGRGTILRFLDLGGAARTATLRLPLTRITEAWQDDAVERDKTRLKLQDEHSLTFPVKTHEIVTLRVLSKIQPPPGCGRYCGDGASAGPEGAK